MLTMYALKWCFIETYQQYRLLRAFGQLVSGEDEFVNMHKRKINKVILPFCCLAQPPSLSLLWLKEYGHLKFGTSPLSVVGGASRSAFWSSNGTFCGPRIEAPSWPRSGVGDSPESVVHSSSFGSELAYGISSWAGAANEVERRSKYAKTAKVWYHIANWQARSGSTVGQLWCNSAT